MINLHILHGFNVRDGGKDTTDTLIPFIKRVGLGVIQHDYGFLEFMGVLHRNNRIAKALVKTVSPGDVGLGHSNGCAILVKAARAGANFDKLILINPALDKNVHFPLNINEVHVFHSKHDKAVVFAKWLRRVVFWRKSFLWGEMGNKGYQGFDERVTNHDISHIANGHSKIFKGKSLLTLQAAIDGIVNKELGKQ